MNDHVTLYCMCVEQPMYGCSHYIHDMAAHPVLHLLTLVVLKGDVITTDFLYLQYWITDEILHYDHYFHIVVTN